MKLLALQIFSAGGKRQKKSFYRSVQKEKSLLLIWRVVKKRVEGHKTPNIATFFTRRETWRMMMLQIKQQEGNISSLYVYMFMFRKRLLVICPKRS